MIDLHILRDRKIWHGTKCKCQLSILIWNEMVKELSEDFQSMRDLFPVDKIKSWFKINAFWVTIKKKLSGC